MTPADLNKIKSARLGIIILRDMCRTVGLTLGEQRAAEVLADLDSIIERRKAKIVAAKSLLRAGGGER
jgi:hypothetical protein